MYSYLRDGTLARVLQPKVDRLKAYSVLEHSLRISSTVDRIKSSILPS
jgi:hypothetical protein